MSIFDERTIKLMIESNFDKYIKLMADCEMPTKNKVTLIFMKVKDFEKEANQEILDEAMERKAAQERKRHGS